jgi:hypothetical protein
MMTGSEVNDVVCDPGGNAVVIGDGGNGGNGGLGPVPGTGRTPGTGGGLLLGATGINGST